MCRTEINISPSNEEDFTEGQVCLKEKTRTRRIERKQSGAGHFQGRGNADIFFLPNNVKNVISGTVALSWWCCCLLPLEDDCRAWGSAQPVITIFSMKTRFTQPRVSKQASHADWILGFTCGET